ncbi:sugar phosphate isomerase/epimerase [Shewanella sp. UCD-KL12]|uniref:sugar phosphate isomerase/epimerase family protein n=1 Tax=Shewanella sp. UCD-KL12 TaxID=1917163 RepID=UPI0009FAAC70|nr:TIM barrel protein [Shewanella sp. UCD-KL12]
MSVLPKVGIQLCSVKNELREDVVQTLTLLSQMGFAGVEFAGEFGQFTDDPKGLKCLLDSLGLEPCGAHIQLSQFTDNCIEQQLNFYRALGIKLLIVAWDERAWSDANLYELIAELNQLHSRLVVCGFQLGFHNHQHEFDQFQQTTFWDVIALSTPHDFVMQMDVGWLAYAGKNPLEYVERYPGRTWSTHYKAKMSQSVSASGLLSLLDEDSDCWLKLLSANINVGGTQWVVIEHNECQAEGLVYDDIGQAKAQLDKLMRAFSAEKC